MLCWRPCTDCRGYRGAGTGRRGPAVVVSSYRCCTICGGANPEGEAMSTIAEWLASLGMSEYAERFAENRIDLPVLRDLTDQDLKDLDIFLGDRRKILRAISELDGGALSGESERLAPAAAAETPTRQHSAERR